MEGARRGEESDLEQWRNTRLLLCMVDLTGEGEGS